MRILLTGATGFIGRHLAHRLAADGHTVIAAVRDAALWQSRLPGREWRACDFTRDLRPEDWTPRLADIDLVINAVGIISEGGGQRFDTVQAQAPAALFTACNHAGIRVLQVSALGAGQRGPLPPFLASKRAADDALWQLPGDAVIVYPGIVIGEGGNSTALFTRLAALPRVPVPGNGRQRLNPIHIDDLCAALAHLVAHWPGGKQRQVLTGADTLTFRELLALLREWMGMAGAGYLPVPRPLLQLAAGIGERVAPRGLLRRDTLALLDTAATPPNSYAALPPRPLREALWARPPGTGLRTEAVLQGLQPLLLGSLAFVWILTGLVSLWWNLPAGYALLEDAGIRGPLATACIAGGGLLDLALGLLMLTGWRRRRVLQAQVAVTLAYLPLASLVVPSAWLDPLGALGKTLPLLALTGLLLALEARPAASGAILWRGVRPPDYKNNQG